MSTLNIRTIAFPDEDLAAAVASGLSEDDRSALDFVVWAPKNRLDADVEARIDAVVLPYMGAGNVVEALRELPALKMVQLQSTGYDVVNDLVGEVAVTTGAGAHAAATAELALALALGSLRGIDVAARNMSERRWDHQRRTSLADRQAMIIGVGGIGEEIRRRLEPFDVSITRVGSTARVDDHGDVHGVDELPELLPATEVVFLITPLTSQTHHLVDAEFLDALPDGALIVNVARGPVVDTGALVAELQSGRLQAALDVVDPEPLPADHPLWSTPNTLITPHEGGDTSAFEPRIHAILAEQCHRIVHDEALLNEVTH